MISSLLIAGLLLLGPNAQSEEIDPLNLQPSTLPVAESGRWQELFEGPDMVLERVPEEIVPLMDRSRSAYLNRNYPAALTSYYEILRAQPDFPPALLELGTVYFRLRRYGDTVTCLERFVSVAPLQAWRTQALAHSYYSLGRYDEARAHYGLVLVGIPGSVEAMRGLALTHYRLGDSEAALEHLSKVLELDDQHAEAFQWRAQILYEEERSEEALEAAIQARDLDRYSPRPWYLLWQIHLDLGNTKDAAAAQREWQRVDSLAQQVRSLKGQLLYRPGDYGLAMNLASLQRELGDINGVRQAFNIAIVSRPAEVTELSLRIHILDVLFELNDKQGAAQAAAALGEICADEAEAWKRLQIYYARVGNSQMQVRAGELYLRLSREE